MWWRHRICTKIYNKCSLSSGPNRASLLVLTVSLIGGKKPRETIVSDLKYLWDNGATNIMIKRRHTKPYAHNIRSNKSEYSTATETYCTAHEVKVPFLTTKFSISMKILHRFHVNNNEGDLDIGYNRIICHDLMVQLGLSAGFKRQVPQRYGTTVPIK